MLKHLMVPLDGSALAEVAVPVAAAIAEAAGARVTLLHVIEQDAPEAVHGQRHLRTPAEALLYLGEICKRFPAAVAAESHVHTRKITDVAHSLADHADEMAVDLVVMCRHGKSGLRGLLFGSIAQQLVNMGITPVLLLSPEIPNWRLTRVLVPLDGAADHEQSLAVADELARLFNAALELLVVVPTVETLPGSQTLASGFLPGAARMMLEMSEVSAREYLAQAGGRLPPRAPAIVASVRRGDPAATILETALKSKADLVAMGTHGTTGTSAFWAASVTAKVIAREPGALLLVPAPEQP